MKISLLIQEIMKCVAEEKGTISQKINISCGLPHCLYYLREEKEPHSTSYESRVKLVCLNPVVYPFFYSVEVYYIHTVIFFFKSKHMQSCQVDMNRTV